MLFEASNEPISTDTPSLIEPVDSSSSFDELDRPLIRFNEYEWGENFIRILSEKTAEGMLPGTGYTYNENVGSFSRELVFSEEYAGHLFRCYYDFDQNDHLVSVMLSLNQKLSPTDTVSLQCDLNKMFISLFGPWDNAYGLYDSESNESLTDYTDAVIAGKKEGTAIWYDSCGTQLYTKCLLNSATGQIDLILVFSTSDYAI